MKKWYVCIEWRDVFGEWHNSEIPCTSKANAEKISANTHYQLKHDAMVSSFRVFPILR